MSRIQNAFAKVRPYAKAAGYTVGAALVAGAAYSAYQVFKAGGADAAARVPGLPAGEFAAQAPG